ncbi:uncharacterized protein LOC109853041 isoform X2 [Pseudomyrmex gracilis]|nr:uncharacterized protein LOC109853041 isoform X2 [Pseudomyrmex gracilis]XP_020280355.1 uncharacterized protein LOC109853041 isoform X2 [Pseudomyrmex gracilis]
MDNQKENVNPNNPKGSLMGSKLCRQLKTHKNVLRLLQEYKLASTQINGQRILSIQPTRWSGPAPGIPCEIFVGRIPKDIYEDTLYPLFRTVGEIFQIRLMVDMAELTRGYCFIMYTTPEDAERAIKELDEYEILPGQKIRVLASLDKCKLYIGPLPWYIESEEVVRVIYASAWDINYVATYRYPNSDAAYAIVSFNSHRNAALARRKLRPERLFKCNEVHVEWARVDWKPSNVYEDCGIVDDNGDVQITRKFIPPKKEKDTSSSSSSTQNSNPNGSNQKPIPPISPPKNNTRAKVSKSTRSKGTRSNTLSVSEILDNASPFDKVLKDKIDTNDNNIELLDKNKYNAKNKTSREKKDDVKKKNDNDANSFYDFDMWNSTLSPTELSSLPNTTSNSINYYEKVNKLLNKMSHDWQNNGEDSWLKSPSSSNGCQYPNSTGALDYNHSCYNNTVNKVVGMNRPIAANTVPYQALPQQYHPLTPCFVLVPTTYMRPKNVSYPQLAIANHVGDSYNQMQPPLSIKNNFHHFCNGQIGSIATDQKSIIEKFGNSEFRCGEISAKSTNGVPTLYPTTLTPNMIFPSVSVSNQVSLNTLNDGETEKRPRPIVKQI